MSMPTNRLSLFWPEDENGASAPVTLKLVTDAERPATYSFAEWAPRIRAERAARERRCPCTRVGGLCSVCRDRSA